MSYRILEGRRAIYTNENEITQENVVQVLNNALFVHQMNREDITYLYNYLKGRQPIKDRVKAVREEICNRIVINRANEIVTFKTANFIGEPAQYISRGSDESTSAKVEQLNAFMRSENKASKDMRLAYWMFTCGVGYRLILNDKAAGFADEEIFDEAPFEIYTLDPRSTFVVRSNDVSKRVLMGVTYSFLNDRPDEINSSDAIYSVYTKDTCYRIRGNGLSVGKIESIEKYNFGMVPIVEYQCNPLRMGAFEIVIDLLDAINLTESNRLDGVEQFIQALMVFENVDISSEQYDALRDKGAIKISSRDGNSAKVYYLNEQLDQQQTQTLVDDMYDIVKEIVGIPSQGNANTSDSSNNGAVIMKNGWQNAEARSKETEMMWTESDTDFSKICLKICRDSNALDLKLSEIELKFQRRSYEDIMTKAQVFSTLIGTGESPQQAYSHSNLSADPASDAIIYEKYQEAEQKKTEQSLEDELIKMRQSGVSEETEETVVTEDGE